MSVSGRQSGDEDTLDPTDIHNVLSNRRRQLLLGILDSKEEVSMRWLSERIAEIETGESPPPRDTRKSVYVSLKQSHLPLLDDLGLVDVDQENKTVVAGDNLDTVRVYTEIVPKHGLFWSEYYIAVALLGFLTVFASSVGVPLLAAVSPHHWAYLFFVAIVASGAYQLYLKRNRSPFEIHQR